MPPSQEIIDRTFHSKLGGAAYHAVEILLDAGFEAWWVGGSVRDMLLGEIPKEIDIATSATPADITKLFPKNDGTSAALGAVVVSYKGQIFELTTFRQEHELSNGRLPASIAFCDRKTDAQRRDITINCVYFHPISGEIFDPYGGEHDLTERLIRFIGDPGTRIRHDALRLLRAIRFRARIDGQYHPETYQALHKHAGLIRILSSNRRLEELEKMLLGPRPNRAFEDMWETDVIEHLIPELHKCKGVAQPADFHKEGDVWDHTMLAIASFTEDHGPDVRWATLLHDIGKTETFLLKERIRFDHHASTSADIARKVLQRLQCPGKRIERVDWTIRHHMMMSTFFDMDNERKSHWYFHPWFTDLLQLFWLDIAGTEPPEYILYNRIIKDYNNFLNTHPLPPKPLLSGEQVMELLGMPPGEKVGEIMRTLYDAQIRKEITSKAEAVALLKKRFS